MKQIRLSVSSLNTPAGRRKLLPLLAWILLALILIGGITAIGGLGGYRAAQIEYQKNAVSLGEKTLTEQYALAVQDLKEERYDFARQRCEFILAQDPAFPGASEGLASAVEILYATATPTPVPPSPTPSSTPDLRPVEDLFNQVKTHFMQGEWDQIIEVIIALRKADVNYHVTEVDGMLYRTLRNRGIAKIIERGDLEGGIYDLTLAEGFGPLDVNALTYRDLARYYGMGSGFWEVYPEQAVYYFGLVASAMPSLRDGSGWTAAARYREAIVQFGDQLAREGDWCRAQEQYELALSYSPSPELQATAESAAYECMPPTETAEPETATATLTLSPTLLPSEAITPSPTAAATTITPASPTVEPTATTQPESSPTATVDASPTQSPSDTPSPTVEPGFTDTPPVQVTDTPAPTETPALATEVLSSSTPEDISTPGTP